MIPIAIAPTVMSPSKLEKRDGMALSTLHSFVAAKCAQIYHEKRQH